jgi:membrane associated rhomboid family serine protease
MVLVGGFHLAGLDAIPFLGWSTSSVGASGAVFVLLAWYCFAWPDQEINVLLLPFIFTARQMLPLWFMLEFGFAAPGVDHPIHVLGALMGWLAITGYRRHLKRPPRPPRKPKKPRSPHLRLVGTDDDKSIFH